jgi:mRNA interferase RelE/StbE
MEFTVIFHPAVKDDVAAISQEIRARIKSVIATRLTSEPAKYGKPLRGTLAGYWKLRVGDWHVIYGIYGQEVVIFAIKHRSRVYDDVSERF